MGTTYTELLEPTTSEKHGALIWTSAPEETVDAVIWVLVDDQGRYVADADPEALIDEYACQVGTVTFGRPTQLVRLTATVPIPRTVEMTAIASNL